MKKIIFAPVIILLGISMMNGQNFKMQIEGSLLVGDSQDPSPDPGTIRWTGVDFEAYNGHKWVTLTGGKTAPATDLDGNIYPSLRIGDQIWLTESLRTTKYRDGSAIPLVTDKTQWSNLTSGAYCWYDNNNIYEHPQGKLYNWHSLTDIRGLCPEGWREPSQADFIELIAYLGGTSVAGGKAKQEGITTWQSPNEGATNSSGYSGVGYGTRYSDGNFSVFFPLGTFAQFWTSTEITDKVYSFFLANTHASFLQNSITKKKEGLSVRCLK